MQEKVLINTTAHTLISSLLTAQTSRVTQLTLISRRIVIPVSSALLHTSVDLEVFIDIIWVARQAGRWLIIGAILAWIVTLGGNDDALSLLIDEIVERIVDVVKGGHLERVRGVTQVGRAQAIQCDMDPLSISWFKRLTIRQLDDIRDPNSSGTEVLPDL